MVADNLKPGAWTARWGENVVLLRAEADSWGVKVWRWTADGGYAERMELGRGSGFPSPKDAAAWACAILRENGAKVMVLGSNITLEQLLDFRPAPEAS